MQTFDQSLFDLYTKELITLDEALARASNADEFKLRIQGIRSAADAAREEMASQMRISSDSRGNKLAAIRRFNLTFQKQ